MEPNTPNTSSKETANRTYIAYIIVSLVSLLIGGVVGFLISNQQTAAPATSQIACDTTAIETELAACTAESVQYREHIEENQIIQTGEFGTGVILSVDESAITYLPFSGDSEADAETLLYSVDTVFTVLEAKSEQEFRLEVEDYLRSYSILPDALLYSPYDMPRPYFMRRVPAAELTEGDVVRITDRFYDVR